MKRRTAAASALLLVLVLAGCGATVETAPGASDPGAPSSASASESPEPLTAEKPTGGPDALFLTEVRSRLANLGAASSVPNATDDQLLVAGAEACEKLAGGTPFDDVTVIEGEERVQSTYFDSAAIASASVLYLCPELNGSLN